MINPALCLVGIYTDSFTPRFTGMAVASWLPGAGHLLLAMALHEAFWCGSWLSGIGLVNIRNVNLCACIHTIHLDIFRYRMILYIYYTYSHGMSCPLDPIFGGGAASGLPRRQTSTATMPCWVSYEKASQWLRALQTLLAFPSARRPCDTDDRNVFQGNWGKNRREAVVFWCFLPCAKKKCAPGLQQTCTATVRSSVHAKRGHNGTLGGTMYHFSCASNLVQEAWIVSRSGKLVSQTRERWEHTSPIHGVHVVRPNHKIS